MKTKVTQEMLLQSGVTITVNEDALGGYNISQPYIKGKYNSEKRWKVARPVWVNTSRHPHGKSKSYLMTCVKVKEGDDYYKSLTMPLHRLVYIYFKGNFPENYDIDHIDNDPFNCSIDNLEAVSRKENLNKRECNGANQYRNSTNWNTWTGLD